MTTLHLPSLEPMENKLQCQLGNKISISSWTKLEWRTTAWVCCQKGGVIHSALRLHCHPTLGGLCRASGPLEGPLDAIERGALSGKSSPAGTWLGTYSEGCVSAPTGLSRLAGCFCQCTRRSVFVLSSKDSFFGVQHGASQPESSFWPSQRTRETMNL